LRIIGLIAGGTPVEEIARQLGLSAQTVRNHGITIRRKGEAFSRTDGMRWPWQRDADEPPRR
jgi:DNA-binding CsgD family transcriptional regulator